MHAVGYIDPGSGLLLWQIIAAVCVGVLFYIKKVRTAVARFFRRLFNRGAD